MVHSFPQNLMQTRKIVLFLFMIIASRAGSVIQQDTLPAELKESVLHDAACVKPVDGQDTDATISALAIRAGGREVGTIVAVQGTCHCQSSNCDTLVYLRNGDQYRLALREKYASLHPMKIVKYGMPSLTGEFAVSAQKMETTVYDWDGKGYRPSLCATVIKGTRLPRITQHPCRAPSQ
jgi:hypothetical protein